MASLTPVSSSEDPVFVIFLDSDGVIMGNRTSPDAHERIQKKIEELFGERGGNCRNYTPLEWRIAQSHFFSPKALANLDKLIERVSKVARVVIVISSGWRNHGTVEEIKDRMFAVAAFSKLIIDKIPDEDDLRVKKGEIPLAPIAKEKYGIDLTTRGGQIEFWLRENWEKYHIKSFAILDDDDNGISSRFPRNFVHIKSYELFSEANAEKAYAISTMNILKINYIV